MITSEVMKYDTRLLFGLPAVLRNGYWIIFSQNFENLARVPEDRVNFSETRAELIQNGFIGTKKVNQADSVMHITLILTNDCNLRCKYCFVGAGDFKKEVIELKTIFSALRHAAEIAKGRKLSIAFFGGEPTTQFGLLKQAVMYAKQISSEHGLPEPEFSVISNGVFGGGVGEFFIENKFLVTISADGPSVIQNFQRPAFKGDSSRILEKTLKRFSESGHQIKLRVTVTEFSIDMMEDIVRWYAGFGFAKPEIHFESVSISGRARSNTNETGQPDVNVFILNLKKAIEAGNELGVGVINSSFMNLMNSPSEFCDSNTNNRFAVTVDGHVTKCVEVQDSCHPAAKSLLLEGYNKTTDSFVQIENQSSCGGEWQVVEFKSANGNNCFTCFAKNVCGGGCPVRNFHTTGETHVVDPYRCKVTREIIPYLYVMIDEASSAA